MKNLGLFSPNSVRRLSLRLLKTILCRDLVHFIKNKSWIGGWELMEIGLRNTLETTLLLIALC